MPRLKSSTIFDHNKHDKIDRKKTVSLNTLDKYSKAGGLVEEQVQHSDIKKILAATTPELEELNATDSVGASDSDYIEIGAKPQTAERVKFKLEE